MWGALEVCVGFRGERSWRPVTSVLLPPCFRWVSTSAWVFFYGCAAYFWGIFPLDSFLGDCFWEVITFHYCFFFVYYFNVVHVFCVMRNSPDCDTFYCIIILKAICLILWKLKNWNMIHKKTLCRSCRYLKMKFEKDRCQNASFQNMFHD